MLKILRAYPLESLATVVGLVVLAIGLALSQSSGWVVILASILQIVGATTSSFTTAWTLGHVFSRRISNRELEILRVQLSTEVGQITRTLSERRSTLDDNDPFMPRIEQSVTGISNVIREIGLVTGATIRTENDAIVAAIQEVADLSRRLGVLSEEAEETEATDVKVDREKVQGLFEDFQLKFDNILANLAQADSRASTRTYRSETIPCPKCGVSVQFTLGDQVGDTASPRCQSCSTRFNAHRGQLGIFTRLPTAARTVAPAPSSAQPSTPAPIALGARRQESVGCPNCNTPNLVEIGTAVGDTSYAVCSACEHSFNIHRGINGLFTSKPQKAVVQPCPHCGGEIRVRVTKGSAQIRFCFVCGAKSQLMYEEPHVRLLEVKPKIPGNYLSADLVQCTKCNDKLRVLGGRNNAIFAVCLLDDSLVEAPIPKSDPVAPTAPNTSV